jgi:hypothetical protein
MPRTTSLIAAAVAFAVALTGCSSGGKAKSGTHTVTTLSQGAAASINQRLQNAVQPANTALSGVVAQAVGVSSSGTGNLKASLGPAESTLNRSVKALRAISGPAILRSDLNDVVNSMNTVIGDLQGLNSASGSAQSQAISKLVADSGKVSAAENVAQFEVSQLSQ